MQTTRIHRMLAAAAVTGLALAGCASAPGGDAPDDQSATQFVACLTAAGVDAKLSDDGFVLVRTGQSDGLLVDDGDGTSVEVATSGQGAPGELPLFFMVEDDEYWVAAASSAFFGGDPAVQDAYAACEAQLPEFRQPEVTMPNDAEHADIVARQQEAALAFAACARDAGFSWVADPEAESGAIALPEDLAESEFRALLDACWSTTGDVGIGWSIEGELSFDWAAVLMEYAMPGGQPPTSTGGEG